MAPPRIPNQMRTIETDRDQLVIEHGGERLVIQVRKKKGETVQLRLVGPRSFAYQTEPRDPLNIPPKPTN